MVADPGTAREGFNPLPARRPGATTEDTGGAFEEFQFQSSPSPKAGSYAPPNSVNDSAIGFNPLPARRPGAT